MWKHKEIRELDQPSPVLHTTLHSASHITSLDYSQLPGILYYYPILWAGYSVMSFTVSYTHVVFVDPHE